MNNPEKSNKNIKRSKWVKQDTTIEGGTFSYEVVNGDELRAFIDAWEVKWQRTRPSFHGRGKYAIVTYLVANKFLQEKTGLSKTSVEAIRRTDEQKREWISLRIADKIMTAIGQQAELSNGELKIVPNPQLSLERFQAWLEERGCA